MKNILDLPKIHGNQPRKIHQFCERLLYDVQSLETMGKLSEVNGNVAFTMDKLSSIRGNVVRNDALKSWTRRNPVDSAEPPSRNYNTRQQEGKTRACVYCDETSHN